MNNRLYREVREKKGLVYNVTFNMTLPRFLDLGFVSFELSPVPSRVTETVELVLQVIQSIRASGIDDMEFQEV